MWAVAYELCCISLVTKDPCDVVWSASVEGLPAIVRPTKNSTSHVGSMRYGWKTSREEILNARRTLADKRIQHGCVDRPFCIVEQIVESKRIGYYENDVFHRERGAPDYDAIPSA